MSATDNPTRSQVLSALWSTGYIDIGSAFEDHATILNLGGLMIEISGSSDAFKAACKSSEFQEAIARVKEALGWGPEYQIRIALAPSANYERIRQLTKDAMGKCETVIKGDLWLGENWDLDKGCSRCDPELYSKMVERFKSIIRELDAITKSIARLGGKLDYIKIYEATRCNMVKSGQLSPDHKAKAISSGAGTAKAVSILFGGKILADGWA